jgi:hypothetical protein
MRADSSLSSKEEILERDKERGICLLFVCRYWPSGEKVTALTSLEGTLSVLRQNPVAVSHRCTVLSFDADTTSWLFDEKVTTLMAP